MTNLTPYYFPASVVAQKGHGEFLAITYLAGDADLLRALRHLD